MKLAFSTLDRARTKWSADDDLNRRFVVAALLAGEYERGLQAVDDLVERRVEDEPSLALALMVLYEAFVNGEPVAEPARDRERMLRYADAYRARGGPSLALVETWVSAATAKR